MTLPPSLLLNQDLAAHALLSWDAVTADTIINCWRHGPHRYSATCWAKPPGWYLIGGEAGDFPRHWFLPSTLLI